MLILITSAAGANGAGYGALLAFEPEGKARGAFSDDRRIADPRGLVLDAEQELIFLNSGADRVLALDRNGTVVRDTGPMQGLNPGGAVFGPDGRYYLGLRTARTILAMPTALDGTAEPVLPPGIVPFPRGFAFGAGGRLFLASGIGPAREGDDTILAFARGETRPESWQVRDPQLSPLDLAMAPNGNIVVASEHPFGAPDAVTSVREYAASDGRLVRVFSPSRLVGFRRPRGLRFGPDGNLYCVAQDEVVGFNFSSGQCLGAVVRFPRLHGQALVFLR